MPRKTGPDLFAELRKIDTPTITNVVATYPPTPSVWGSTIRGARTGTRTPRSVVCTQSWERLQGMQ